MSANQRRTLTEHKVPHGCSWKFPLDCGYLAEWNYLNDMNLLCSRISFLRSILIIVKWSLVAPLTFRVLPAGLAQIQ